MLIQVVKFIKSNLEYCSTIKLWFLLCCMVKYFKEALDSYEDHVILFWRKLEERYLCAHVTPNSNESVGHCVIDCLFGHPKSKPKFFSLHFHQIYFNNYLVTKRKD